jgi:hypothetical protein
MQRLLRLFKHREDDVIGAATNCPSSEHLAQCAV